VFKRRVLSNALPQFTVHYVYCWNNYFKKSNRYDQEKLYYKKNKLPIFWGDDVNYKSKIIKFIKKKTKFFVRRT
jgi:hypothetical protein